MTDRPDAPSALGQRAGKIDGPPKVTGAAVFADDLRLPRMLIGKILRSPHAHARIARIDVSRARALPGVHAVLTGEDLPERYGVIPVSQDETALKIGKVRMVGDEVAAVAAVDEDTALAALALIEVDYEPLPEILTLEDALTRSDVLIHEDAKNGNVTKRVFQRYGNVDEGFAEADVIVEDEYLYEASTHVPLETHCAVGHYTPDGKLTVWSSTQIPHYLHRYLSRVLGIDAARVRVIKPEVGAGYGGKSDPFPLEFCAAELSRRTGRPVKIAYTREEVFYTHRGRHQFKMWLKMGVKRSGEITAIDYKCWLDGGAYSSFGVVTSYYAGVFMTLPYTLPRYRFEAIRVFTNKPPAGPKRGHGAIQPRFALELHIDKAAAALGIDPVELRRRNCVEPGTETVNGLRITSVALKECLDAVTKASGYHEKRGRLGPNRGIGLAASTYMCGANHSIYASEGPHSTVQMKVDRSGQVAIFSGTADIGQGSVEMLGRIAAEVLGISTRDMRVVEGDTDLTPVDLGSYSSRVTFMAGNAVLQAAARCRDQIAGPVAAKLGCAPADLVFRDHRIWPGDHPEWREDPAHSVSFRQGVEVAEGATGQGIGAMGSYRPPRIGSRFRQTSVGPSPAYSFTAQVAEVTVDPETGEIAIDRIWAAHDCGKAINPQVVEGQVEGCVYMGVGEALLEEHVFRGALYQSPSILEYKIPTSLDTPPIEVLLVESHDPEGPFGAKEAGEGPQLSTVPAIANAVWDATGVWMNETPFLPERVLKALEAKRKAEAKGRTAAVAPAPHGSGSGT